MYIYTYVFIYVYIVFLESFSLVLNFFWGFLRWPWMCVHLSVTRRVHTESAELLGLLLGLARL